MKANLLGLECVDYTKKDGNRCSGVKLYISKEFSSNSSGKGIMTDSIWVSSSAGTLYKKVQSFDVPSQIDVQYELNGRFAQLVDINLIRS